MGNAADVFVRGHQVVGLYGMGGAGKTTISRAICNKMLGGLVGKVCYIEFGKMDVVDLLRKVLQELTEADSAVLKDKHHDQVNLHLVYSLA